jgi:hypothetical protein
MISGNTPPSKLALCLELRKEYNRVKIGHTIHEQRPVHVRVLRTARENGLEERHITSEDNFFEIFKREII